MEKYVTVEVEHTHYARLFTLDRSIHKSLALTTLVDRQQRADVRIFLITKEEKILLHAFSVTSLPPQKAGEPKLQLSADFDGHRTLSLSLSVNGRFHSRKEVPVKKYLRSKGGFLPWAGAAAALILLIAAGFFVFRSCSTEISSTGQESSPSGGYSAAAPVKAEDQTTTKTDTTEETAATTGTATQDASAPPAGTVSGSETVAGSDTEADSEQEERLETAATEEESAFEAEESAQDSETSEEAAAPQPSFSMEETLYFPPDSARLTDEAASRLRRILDSLVAHPEAQVQIYGHCALYGTERGRKELSRERAQNTLDFLKSEGWNPEVAPALHAMGGDDPLTLNSEEQHLNRRVEILVTPQDNNSDSRQDR